MSTWIFYIDESYNERKFCLSAIGILAQEWNECFNHVQELRRRLNQDYGILIEKEMHAHRFVNGRGRSISNNQIGKWQRSRIFEQILRSVALLPHVMIFNVCLDVARHRHPDKDAWIRLVMRINRTMEKIEENDRLEVGRKLHEMKLQPRPILYIQNWINRYKPQAIIMADEGKESQITGTLRKIKACNPTPSMYGKWSSGETTRNIPVGRVVEDPIFKKSDHSFFIQLADCVAYALLKREVPPTQNIEKYNINQMFDRCLSDVCYKLASRNDPLGIVRN